MTGTPLLRIVGLQVRYGSHGGGAPAVDGVDLEVAAGEVVAVVGESGSGKSSLAHAIIGLLPGSGSVSAGSITFNGHRIDNAPERSLEKIRGAHIGLVPQDPTTSLNPVMRIGDQIAEVLKIHRRVNRRSASAEALRILTEAGLDNPELRFRQYPQDLSGGQRQRVLIGIALACEPELIIADEPTSALDVTVQQRILDHLDARIAATGAGVLLITHDLGVAADRADRIVVMSGGKIVETGAAEEVLTSPRHEYTRKLLAAAPSLARGAGLGARSPAPQTGAAGGPLVSVRGLEKSFRVARGHTIDAVRGISFDIARGQTFSIVGESGSGKSTTARIVARLEVASAGDIDFDGTTVTGISGRRLRDFRRQVQLVHQNPYASLNPKLTIAQIVAEPLQAFGIGNTAARRQTVRDLLDQVALDERYLSRYPAQLSGGQRQRVAIARALSLNPQLVVLDEPVSALDVSVQAQILDLLDRLQREHGLSYLFISHDLAVVRQISDQVAVMRHGEIVEHGAVHDVFDDPRHPYTRELLDAIPGKMLAQR